MHQLYVSNAMENTIYQLFWKILR